jgi:uncharacterized membrane protein
MVLANLTVLATALFTGAAAYVSLVEHPARLRCSNEIALAQWRPSYKRGTAMQASLAMAGTLLGISAFLSGAGLMWLVAGLLLGSVVPFTLLVVIPTNRRLEDPALDASGETARRLLIRWGQLHAVRSAISLVALVLMLFIAR